MDLRSNHLKVEVWMRREQYDRDESEHYHWCYSVCYDASNHLLIDHERIRVLGLCAGESMEQQRLDSVSCVHSSVHNHFDVVNDRVHRLKKELR